MNDEEFKRIIEQMRAAASRVKMNPAPAWEVETSFGPGMICATIDGAELLCSEHGTDPARVLVPSLDAASDGWMSYADYLEATK